MARRKSEKAKKWAITVRREQISEHTLDMVIEAPTLKAAREAALKVAREANAGDLGWQLYDYDWSNKPPTVDKHGKARESDPVDHVADADGNLVEGGKPTTPTCHIRIAREDD